MVVLFYIIPGLMIAGILFAAYATIQRSAQLQRAWDSGLTAQGRCLRMFTTTSGGSGDSRASSTLHHVYEFTARDGRVIRFEETGGPATRIEGDSVTVYYTEGDDAHATARAPDHAGNKAGTTLWPGHHSVHQAVEHAGLVRTSFWCTITAIRLDALIMATRATSAAIWSSS